MPRFEDLSPGVVVEGPILPEPVEVLTTVAMGSSVKLVGKGLHTGQVRDPILDADQLAQPRPRRDLRRHDPERLRVNETAIDTVRCSRNRVELLLGVKRLPRPTGGKHDVDPDRPEENDSALQNAVFRAHGDSVRGAQIVRRNHRAWA